MRGKTHGVIGLLSTIETSLLFNLPITIFDVLVATIFSLIPDLDQPNSSISRYILKYKISKYIYKLFVYALNLIIFFISIHINKNFIVSAIVTFIVVIIIEAKITHSFIRKLFLSLIFILLAICLYIIKAPIYFIVFILILVFLPWLKHRSFSHSIFSLILIYFIFKQIDLIFNTKDLSIYSTLGYGSHIFLGDLFTKQGVPLFYPISNKKISFGFLKVGTTLSNFIEYIFITFLIISIALSIKFL